MAFAGWRWPSCYNTGYKENRGYSVSPDAGFGGNRVAFFEDLRVRGEFFREDEGEARAGAPD